MSENSSELPVGQIQTVVDNVIDLDRAIEKSTAEIAASINAPIKRGRGRPRKIVPEPASSSVIQPARLAVPPFDATPYLKQAVQMPFAVASAKFKCDELKVTDEQAEPVAIAANNFLKAYAPNLEKADPKTIAAVALATALGMLCFEKYSVYQLLAERPKEMAVQSEITNQSPTEPHAPAQSIFSGRVPASEAFRAKPNLGAWPQ